MGNGKEERLVGEIRDVRIRIEKGMVGKRDQWVRGWRVVGKLCVKS